MSGWGSIALGTRLEKLVESRFVTVWSSLISRGLRRGDAFLIVGDRPAHKASNDLVRRFLETDCDTLLMLDSDADVHTEFISDFRDYEPGWEYDIFQSFFVRRGHPPTPIWFAETQPTEAVAMGFDVTVDVRAVGTHATLFRRRVFETLLGDDDPAVHEWFYYPRHSPLSEDVSMCLEAGAAGLRMGATTAIHAGHICRMTTGYETYQEYITLNRLSALAQMNAAHMEANGNG